MRLWLKMKILSRFGSQTRFARALGKSDDWLSCIVTGRRDPTEQDKELIISTLGPEYAGDVDMLFEKAGEAATL